MAVMTYAEEFVSPSRMFKVLLLDSHNVIPKVVPRGIKMVEFLEGDGSVGSIKQTNFADGGKTKYMRHRMDALDREKLYFKDGVAGACSLIVAIIAVGTGAQMNICNVTIAGLEQCLPAIRDPNPQPPTQACCTALKPHYSKDHGDQHGPCDEAPHGSFSLLIGS